MSVEIHWETLRGGPKGDELAEKIRVFIHERFQQIKLPRFISSVKVHSFDFGDTPPDIEIKDVCDPLADFYEDEDSDASEEGGSEGGEDVIKDRKTAGNQNHQGDVRHQGMRSAATGATTMLESQHSPGRHNILEGTGALSPLFMQHPAGTSSAAYFHLPYGTGLSGRTTPLAAVASGHFLGGWTEGIHQPIPDNLNAGQMSISQPRRLHSGSVGSSVVSSSDPDSRPSSEQFNNPALGSSVSAYDHAEGQNDTAQFTDDGHPRLPGCQPARDPNDLQIVSRVRYSGNMSLVMTAEILLDYPMSSFVGIPLQLNITGFSFDGVAILAHAEKKLHFCFLSPEDAGTFLGSPQKDADGNVDEGHVQAGEQQGDTRRLGGLLEEIRVESEIGDKIEGKQVLKNVRKVERFVLEQVQKIFEDEFVFPSFWTVLV